MVYRKWRSHYLLEVHEFYEFYELNKHLRRLESHHRCEKIREIREIDNIMIVFLRCYRTPSDRFAVQNNEMAEAIFPGNNHFYNKPKY